MLRLLQTFLEIALWRKGPQDLPASHALTGLVLVAYVAIEFIGVQLFDLNLRAAVIFIGVDVLMLSVWLWAVLAFFGRRQRFVQTITATFGVGVLILLLDIVMRTIQLAVGIDDAYASGWLFIRFMIIALVMGRIFMHALDRGLVTGMALTVAIIYSTEAVAQFMLDSLGRSG
ncbi:MAG: hypothetical protein ACREV5_15040 [Steroidobacter sp.]